MAANLQSHWRGTKDVTEKQRRTDREEQRNKSAFRCNAVWEQSKLDIVSVSVVYYTCDSNIRDKTWVNTIENMTRIP